MYSYSFKFYAILDRLGFCHSYVAKFFFIAFLAVHVPLIATVWYLLSNPNPTNHWLIIGVLVAATLLGTALSFLAFWHLLGPIFYIGHALHIYLQTGVPPTLPTHFRDEVGALLRDTRYVLQSLHAQRIQLSEAANRDHLTGLLNRRAAEHALQELLVASEQLPGTTLSLGLLDIDHFKQVNDKYGHNAGDTVLRMVSAILVETVRDHDWAARWGGEEFLIVVTAPPEGAGIALERLRQRIAENPFSYGGTQLGLTVSIGYSPIRAGDTVEHVLNRADQALYRAKGNGRNRVEYGTSVETKSDRIF